MSDTPPLFILGGSGMARAAVEAAMALGLPLSGLVTEDGTAPSWFSGRVLSDSTALGLPGPVRIAVAIGDNHQRRTITARTLAARPDISAATLIHPAAVISPSASVGAGCLLLAASVVGAGCVLGEGCTLWSGAVMEHDCTLGAYVSLGPRAALSGGVRVGEGSHIGAGASVSHGLTIGAESIIGTGSAVIRDIPDAVIAYGVPANISRPRHPGTRYL